MSRRCRKLCSDAKSGVNLLPWGASRTFPLMSRFARSSKSCDFSCVAKNRKSDDFLQFFVMLIVNEVQSELSIFQNFAKIVKNRKSDDFLRYLQFFAVLCHLNNH